jgi:hypothetical protein
MDQRQLVEAVCKLTGVVTALEMQTQALLLAAIKSGVHPDVVLRALETVPRPNVPPGARDAYEHVMASFWQRLDEAAFKVLIRDAGREDGISPRSEDMRQDGHEAGISPPLSLASRLRRRVSAAFKVV